MQKQQDLPAGNCGPTSPVRSALKPFASCGTPTEGNVFLDLGEVAEVVRVWLNASLLIPRAID